MIHRFGYRTHRVIRRERWPNGHQENGQALGYAQLDGGGIDQGRYYQLKSETSASLVCNARICIAHGEYNICEIMAREV
jgi:hypothetical protein